MESGSGRQETLLLSTGHCITLRSCAQAEFIAAFLTASPAEIVPQNLSVVKAAPPRPLFTLPLFSALIAPLIKKSEECFVERCSEITASIGTRSKKKGNFDGIIELD